jgi:hypothetical protein
MSEMFPNKAKNNQNSFPKPKSSPSVVYFSEEKTPQLITTNVSILEKIDLTKRIKFRFLIRELHAQSRQQSAFLESEPGVDSYYTGFRLRHVIQSLCLGYHKLGVFPFDSSELTGNRFQEILDCILDSLRMYTIPGSSAKTMQIEVTPEWIQECVITYFNGEKKSTEPVEICEKNINLGVSTVDNARNFIATQVPQFQEKFFPDAKNPALVSQLAIYFAPICMRMRQVDTEALAFKIESMLDRGVVHSNFKNQEALYISSSTGEQIVENRDVVAVLNKLGYLSSNNKTYNQGSGRIFVSAVRALILYISPRLEFTLAAEGDLTRIYNVINIEKCIEQMANEQQWPREEEQKQEKPIDVNDYETLHANDLVKIMQTEVPGITRNRVLLFLDSYIARRIRLTTKTQMKNELEPAERVIIPELYEDFVQFTKDVLLHDSHIALSELFQDYYTYFTKRGFDNMPMSLIEFQMYWRVYRTQNKEVFERAYAKDRAGIHMNLPLDLVPVVLEFIMKGAEKKDRFAISTKNPQERTDMKATMLEYIAAWKTRSEVAAETVE